jgi:hypothetical protein
MSYANRYTATHKQWDHVGNLFPNVEHAEKGPHGRLAGDFIPAPWLPVDWNVTGGLFDKHFEAYTVVSPGKLVACTRQGEAIATGLGDWEDSQHLVPAGLKILFADAAAQVLVYSATDVAQGTIDLGTGAPVAAPISRTRAQLAPLLIGRGLILPSEQPEAFISQPIGVAAHAFYQWAANNGSKYNPADLKNHNFRLQSQVQVLANYQLRLPHVPTNAHTLTMPATLTGGTQAAGSGTSASAADTVAMARYSGPGAFYSVTNANIISVGLSQIPVATDPVTGSHDLSETAPGALTRERSSANALVIAGDWWLDREVGILFLFVAGGASVAGNLGGGANILGWSDYSAPPATVSGYASAVGDIKPGDFLMYDTFSNFIVAPEATAVTTIAQFARVVGQCIGFKTYPKDLLHRVKSQYNNLGNLNAMPGTATRGLPESLTFSGAADREVVINLINR